MPPLPPKEESVIHQKFDNLPKIDFGELFVEEEKGLLEQFGSLIIIVLQIITVAILFFK